MKIKLRALCFLMLCSILVQSSSYVYAADVQIDVSDDDSPDSTLDDDDSPDSTLDDDDSPETLRPVINVSPPSVKVTINCKFDSEAKDAVCETAKKAGLIEEETQQLLGYFTNTDKWWNSEELDKFIAGLDAEKTLDDIKLFRIFRNYWVTSMPRITEVYSANNAIEDCYYRPLLSEIPSLTEHVINQGNLITAYTGFFDLNNNGTSKSYEDVIVEYRNEEKLSRALEILGSDFLLSSETANYVNGSWTYNAVLSEGNPTLSTIVMDIYKAMGIEFKDISIQLMSDSGFDMLKSPASKDIIANGNIIKVDPNCVRTEVFTTRTNPRYYIEKFQYDLKYELIDNNNNLTELARSTLSNGQFIILLAEMMDIYGEPVMSDKEMNLLLQIYGETIPINESKEIQDAYLYLKARGVLEVDLDYSATLNISDMLDILMRVADEDSRTNWKEIQPVYQLNDELINAGYFGANVNVQMLSDLVLKEVEYDYSNVNYYDYYIEFIDGTEPIWMTEDGVITDTVFIPAQPGVHNGPRLTGSQYLGVKQSNGKKYYHLRVPIDLTSTSYNSSKWQGFMQINTTSGNDAPANITLPVGGGVYTYTSTQGEPTSVPYSGNEYAYGGAEYTKENTLYFERRDFYSNEFPDAVSKERRESQESQELVLKEQSNIISTLLARLTEPTIKAYAYTSDTSIVTPKYVVEDSDGVEQSYVASELFSALSNNTTNQAYVQAILSLSTLGKTADNSYNGILIPVDTLVDLGLISQKTADDLSYSEVNEDILTLKTTYGEVTLNNYNKTITKGNTIMQLPDNTVLFMFDIAGSQNNPQNKYIDIRALLGWSIDNVAVIAVADESNNYSLTLAKSSNTVAFSELDVTPLEVRLSTLQGQNVITDSGRITVVPYSYIGAYYSDKYSPILLTSNYPYSNFFIYEKMDGSSGKAYAVVFYIKFVLEGYEQDNPNSVQRASTLTFDEIKLSDEIFNQFSDIWTYRIYELNYFIEDVVTEDLDKLAGSIQYFKGLGWVYLMPTVSEPKGSTQSEQNKAIQEDLTKYLSGEYILPLFRDGSNVIDYNVNYYGDSNKYVISNYGIFNSIQPVTAAPVGVVNFVGNTIVYVSNTLAAKYYDDSVLRLGSLEVKWNTSKKKHTFTYTRQSSSGMSTTEYSLDLKSSAIYRVSSVLLDVKTQQSFNYYAIYGCDIDLKSIETTVDEEVDTVIDITYPEQDEINTITDEYKEKEKFNLENLINMIDNGTSLILEIATLVVPMVGYTLTILLAGFAILADNKLVQGICDKTIDVVKILTFGQKTIHTITLKNSFVSIILGVIVFTLLLDGNIIRLIQYGLEVVDYFTRAMRVT